MLTGSGAERQFRALIEILAPFTTTERRAPGASATVSPA
jgi:hypothetical protein